MMKKKVLLLMLVCILVLFGGEKVFADSGYSAMPSKNYWAEYVYSTIAPKSQTSYKKMYSQKKAVRNLIKEHKQIQAKCSSWSEAAAAVGGISFKIPVVAQIAAISATGAYVVKTADHKFIEKKLETLKRSTKLCSAVYFKWINAKKLEYKIKIVFYAEYKGKVIKNTKKTSYKTGTYKWGSN